MPPIVYRLLADLVVVVHAAFVLFVLLGQVAVLVGAGRGWAWVRSPRFRLLHLAAILVVVLEAWAGITCPLTTWEKWLRDAAGQESYQGDFIANWVHDALFFTAPPWVFTLIYSLFGALVAGTLWVAPLRWRPTDVTDATEFPGTSHQPADAPSVAGKTGPPV
ncbi:MAG: DUF2784 domain-containing protein [Planctomycetaceae bacterium]